AMIGHRLVEPHCWGRRRDDPAPTLRRKHCHHRISCPVQRQRTIRGIISTLLLQHATLLATMDDTDTRWEDGGVYVVDNAIQQVGPSDQLPQSADQVIDARDMAILPGLVNTHHHFYQTLTRNLPAAQDANLFTWLKTLYPIWANLTPEAVAVSTKIAIAELM